MELELNGDKLTGKLGGDTLNGTFKNGKIEAKVKPDPKQTITGTAYLTRAKLDFKWEAHRDISGQTAPKTHTFEPKQFHHHFSSSIEPALRINAGDTAKTWSVDAGGSDSKGLRITAGGNPLTGPCYIEGALPGDTRVVRFNRIRLSSHGPSATFDCH